MIESQSSFSSLFDRPSAGSAAKHEPAESMAQMRAGEVFQVLADAITHDRSWLKDFQDDLVSLPRDLHEVLQEYRRYQFPSG